MILLDNITEWVRRTGDWNYAHPWFAALVLTVLFLAFLGYEVRDHRRANRRHLSDCPFCEAAQGNGITDVVYEWRDAIALVPLNPVVPGHIIVIPRWHVDHAADNPEITARVMRRASELIAGKGHYNIITSIGRFATQTVFHLHIHVVPRAEDDGLALPWTGQMIEKDVTA